MKCKETTQYPECPIVNLQQSQDSDLLSVTTPHGLRESTQMPEGRCPPHPRDPQFSPPLPAVLHQGKAQNPPSCLPTTYLMLKTQVLDSPFLLLPRLGQGPRESGLMDRPKMYLWTLSRQELEGTLIFLECHTFFFFEQFPTEVTNKTTICKYKHS